jgi:hypothetical protein
MYKPYWDIEVVLAEARTLRVSTLGSRDDEHGGNYFSKTVLLSLLINNE